MRFPKAMQLALALADMPQMARTAQRLPLPEDVDALLEIASGDAKIIAELAASSGIEAERLHEAAGFFVEQVLLSDTSDSYRVLGGRPTATTAELRRHMALLMRWLHPDISEHVKPAGALDRGLLANRVARAWDDLKTEDRRAAYDATLAQRAAQEASLRDSAGGRPHGAGMRISPIHAAGMRRLDRPAGLAPGRVKSKPHPLSLLRDKLSVWLRRT